VLVRHKIPKVRMPQECLATASIRAVIGAVASSPKRCRGLGINWEGRQQVLGVELREPLQGMKGRLWFGQRPIETLLP
jgi:hypothetical protein